MKKRRKKSKFVDIVVVFITLGFFVTGLSLFWISTIKIPSFDSFDERQVTQSTKIYDRTGEVLLFDIHNDIKRTVVPFEEISRNLKNATVAIEDSQFYEHHGVRPLATFRAVFIQPLRGKGIQGGSTITQQVVKNTLLTTDKKISRKLKEWVLALKLETVLDKERILEIYLNESPYGGNIYGVEEASLAFFGKNSKDMTLAESAYLAALPKAPTFYSPYGNNRDKLEERKNLVLDRMLELGFITQEEYDEARAEEVAFGPAQEGGIKAPHFVMFVRSYLEEKYGKDLVENGGLKVITTIDYDLQKKAEEIINKYALENVEKFNAKNAGLIAIDPKTGQIISMVGSRNYFDDEIDGNFNITLAHRQPGSAFKPFVYATAFKKGYTPDTVVFDLQTEFQSTCDPDGNPRSSEVNPDDCYMPQNYDEIFRGPISLRNALAQSINIPAIKTLYLAGLKDSLQTSKEMGIASLADVNQYGLTLVLGGGEVSLLDITGAYSVFANEGVKNSPQPILSIEDNQGNILEKFTMSPEKVLDKNIANQISDVLSDNDARAPAFGEYSYLYFPGRDVAVKTGTTNDYKDAWIIGYTPNLAVGTWAGNNENIPMEKKVAGFIVAPMWNAFMQEVIAKYPEEKFEKPNEVSKDTLKPMIKGLWMGGESYIVDKISGKLATEYTPEQTREERVVTDPHSILYWVDKKDPLGPKPEHPENDYQFELWEAPVQKWVANSGIQRQTIDSIPKIFDDVHKPELSPKISIQTPDNKIKYSLESKVAISISYKSNYPISYVDYFINGVFIGSSKNNPFIFSFIPNEITNISQNNTIKAVIYDSVLNKGETTTTFSVNF